jgi:hypothetical protein
MKIETQRLLPRVWGVGLLADLTRPFCHKNNILKQKRIAESERVRRNHRLSEGKRATRLVARTFKG